MDSYEQEFELPDYDTGYEAEENIDEDPLEELQAGSIDLNLLKLDEIQRQLNLLHQEFQSKFKNDALKDEIIDKLHQELHKYKSNIINQDLQSIFMDMIKIIDDSRKFTKHYQLQAPASIDPLKLLNFLESISSDMEDVFSWRGVKPFTCDCAVFDPARQRVLKKIETSDKSQDKIVAESLRSGYEWEGKIIRPEIVSVYIYKASPIET